MFADRLSAAGAVAGCQPAGCRKPLLILHLQEVGSTQDWLRENASQFGDEQWLRVDRQLNGRGRQGRQWRMPEGNFAASCLIRPQPGEGAVSGLSFVASLALYDVLSAFLEPTRLQLKWPNDLLLDGAKLSGILLEREGDTVIMGIGVNLVAAPALPDRATISLRDVGLEVTAAGFAPLLAEAFSKRRAVWRSAGFACIREEWLARAHPIGSSLLVTSGESKSAGRFAGLDREGALLLDLPGGARKTVMAGDIWQTGPGAGEGPDTCKEGN